MTNTTETVKSRSFGIWRILLGLLALALPIAFLVTQTWIRCYEECVAYTVSCCIGALLLTSGILAKFNFPTILHLLLVLAIGISMGFGGAHYARIQNVKNAYAHYREQNTSNWGVTGYEMFLQWAERNDPAVGEALHDYSALEKLEKVIYDMPDTGERASLMMKLDPLERRGQERYNRVTHLLRQHTDFTDFWQKAVIEYEKVALEEAKKEQRAGALREFLDKFPKGKERDNARRALRELYKEAEERYLKLKKGPKASPRAISGLKALLRYLREKDVEIPIIKVHFLPVVGLKGGKIEQIYEKMTGSKQIQAIEPSFNAKANAARHKSIVREMNNAMRYVVGDLFKLEEGSLEGDEPRFLVKYQVLPTGAHYTLSSEKDKPLSQRRVWVGVAMKFLYSLQVPGATPMENTPEKGFLFSVTASPAPNFSVSGSAPNSAWYARTVYSQMVQTAFAESANKLAEAYGLK